MARNEEKAHSMMNKWTTMKEKMAKGPEKKRPFLSSECDDLTEAEMWRRDVTKEISKKVGKIQNAGLGEHGIRDLNDNINKLLREKRHWEKRIRELGGPNYASSNRGAFDAEGHELPGSKGYKYFGAARNLPGVRELFEEQAPPPQKRTRYDMYKGITPDYYGYRDEDDGVLVVVEEEAEQQRIREAEKVWQKERDERRRAAKEAGRDLEEEDESDDTIEESSAATSAELRAHVPVPSQEDMAALILERKKAALLAKYTD